MKFIIPKLLNEYCYSNIYNIYKSVKAKHSVLILRDDGSNGDKEMCAYFKLHGFEVFNYNTKMLLNNSSILDRVDGIAFVGGFFIVILWEVLHVGKLIIESNHSLYTKIIILSSSINRSL